jgi:branched-subunit amino acid transport protein
VNVWVAIVGAGVATFALRISLVALFARVAVPPTVEQVLRLAAPASVAAITALAMAGTGTTVTGIAAVVPWVALAIAAVVAHQTRSIAITVVAGMAAFSVLTAVAP